MAKKAKKKNDDDSTEEGTKKKGGKGKLIAIILVALIVVLGGAGGGLFYLGFLDSMLGIEHEDLDAKAEGGDKPLDLGTPIYHEMSEFVADLKTNECRAPFLKLSLTIQIDQADQAVLIEREPKIIDRILRHLREQERQDLVGKAGAESLRAEVLLIIDATIKPAKVQNVLFRSMILQ